MSAGTRLPSHTYPSALIAAAIGPVAWCINLEVVYALAPRACAGGGRGLLHLSTFCCLGIAILGAALSWFNWGWSGWRDPSDADAGWPARVGFLSLLGIASGSLFALLIVAQWIAILALDPCSP